MISFPQVDILLSAQVISDFQIPATLLNGNWFTVILRKPSDYKPRFQNNVAEMKLIWNGTYPISGPNLYGFDLTMWDPRLELYAALRKQAALSNSTLTPADEIELIQVRDYAHPEPDDIAAGLAAETRPFTLRTGSMFLKDYDGSGGWYDGNKRGIEVMGEAIKWTFWDSVLRS